MWAIYSQKEDLSSRHQEATFLSFSVFSKISPGNMYMVFDLKTVLNDTTG